MNSSTFYRRSARVRKPKWVVAKSAVESDIEVDGEEDIGDIYDDDVVDPDFFLAFDSPDVTPSGSGESK